MDANKSWPLGFEFVDIEIIKHTKEDNEESEEKWDCDQCNLFFLSEEKLIHHKKKHVALSEEVVKCKYCNKVLSITEESKESYSNRKCETCEYRCSKCPQRFLRHSSLLNHERNHTSPKKKRAIINNKKDGVNSKADERVSKKRLIEKANSIQTSNAQNKLTDKHSNRLSPYIKKKSQEKSETPLCEQLHFNSSKMLTNNNKRLSGKLSNSITEKNDSPSKQDCSMNNTITDSQAAPQTKDKTVYYRPFSCHICCANFASDNLLLDHIQTHGENAEGFKCKHCGDKFDDIYKMQYHLAICPLAEDDLESSLRKNILLEFPGRKSTDDNSESFESETPVVRKRGRPKKVTVVPTENVDDSVENEVLSPQRTRGSVRKRKTDEPTSPDISPKVTRSSLARRTVKSRLHEEVLLEDDSDNELDNDGVDPLVFKNKSNENLNESFESEEDSRKKVHSCPFPKCGIKFTREKALLCHMRNHDDDFDEALKCHKCDVPFDDLQSLRTHINICRGIKEEKDDDFNEPNSQAYDLADKTFQSFQRSKGTFVCRVCGRAYLTQERLERCTHVEPPEKTFTCRVCNIQCYEEKRLKIHFRMKHPNKSLYQCNICQTQFDLEEDIAKHKLTHKHNEDDFQCNVCSIKLPTYKALYFHYSNDHTNKGQSICKICNKMFPNKTALQKHSLVHTESQSKHRCIICSKSFGNSALLCVHMKSHRNKKVYKCKICYTDFIDTKLFFKHMLFHASSVSTKRQFKCCICCVAFKERGALKAHIKNCHVVKKTDNKCLICGKSIRSGKMTFINHLYDHSINICENNMSIVEAEWNNKSKSLPAGETFLLPKRGRPRKIPSNVNNNGSKLQLKKHLTSSYSEEPKTESENKSIIKKNRLVDLDKTHNVEVKEIQNEKISCDTRTRSLLKKVHNDNSVFQRSAVTTSVISKASPKTVKNSLPNYSVTKGRPMSFTMFSSTPTPNKTSYQSTNNLNNVKENDQKYSCDTVCKSQNGSLANGMTVKNIEKVQNESTSKPKKVYQQNQSCSDTLQIFTKNLKTCSGVVNEAKNLKTTTTNADSENSIEDINKSCNNEVLIVQCKGSSEIKNDPVKKRIVKQKKEELNDAEKIKTESTESFIKEEKFYQPTLGLTKYGCTTCILSFPSQQELLSHNAQHIY